METTLEEIFSKELKPTHIGHGLDIPAKELGQFPIPLGEHKVFLQVTDEAGMKWIFRLATRKKGPYSKPLISSTAWFRFVTMNKLRQGDKITFYKVNNQVNGQVIGYKVKLQTPGATKIFGAIFKRK